jgi:hypothetical protein
VRNLARNDYGVSARGSSRGIVLIVFLAIILIAFTSIAISHLSASATEQTARAKTTQALIQSRDAIMAFALNNAVPGTLPCPDGDANGLSDPLNVFGVCPNPRGLVPFRTLGILQPLDNTDTSIWYVVAQEYSGTILTPHNSSRASSLRLNTTQPVAFVLFAPNYPLAAQVRVTKTPSAGLVTQYLEGENANAVADNNYTDIRDDSKFDAAPDTQNDQVLGMSVAAFWTEVEGRVLREVNDKLDIYFSACASTLPRAALFGPAGDNGMGGPLEGRVPFDLVVQCPTATPLPAWLTTHWGEMLYYTRCLNLLIPCLTIQDNFGGSPILATAIAIAPGTPFVGQTRPPPGPTYPLSTNDYFELENQDAGDNVFTRYKFTSQPANFNDHMFIVR